MQLKLGDVTIDVVRKDIKNVHLSVLPPRGRVRIAAPDRMSIDIIRVFAISKLAWIRREQEKLLKQERETPREYLDRESHYVWGKRYLLKVVEDDRAPSIEIVHSRLVLRVRPGTSEQKRHDLLEEWYRGLLRTEIPPLIERWQIAMGVKVNRVFIQRMKTKWGSCNQRSASIRLNTDLARKPRECLEYILVHEMAHLFEPTHNDRFRALMEMYLPKWQFRRDLLNAMPLRHERWEY